MKKLIAISITLLLCLGCCFESIEQRAQEANREEIDRAKEQVKKFVDAGKALRQKNWSEEYGVELHQVAFFEDNFSLWTINQLKDYIAEDTVEIQTERFMQEDKRLEHQKAEVMAMLCIEIARWVLQSRTA